MHYMLNLISSAKVQIRLKAWVIQIRRDWREANDLSAYQKPKGSTAKSFDMTLCLRPLSNLAVIFTGTVTDT